MNGRVDDLVRRDCPTCGKPIVADATLCGHCWTKVAPLTGDALREATAAHEILRAAANGASQDTNTPEFQEIVRRDCPNCRSRIAIDATLCGFCWKKVTPL